MRKLFFTMSVLLLVTGCRSSMEKAMESASGKNMDLNGYVFYGAGEMINSETAAPEAKTIIGRLSYKSRKVSIPENTRTPNTGSLKMTRTKSLFGVEEEILEYDFTASDAAAAGQIQKGFQKQILSFSSTEQ